MLAGEARQPGLALGLGDVQGLVEQPVDPRHVLLAELVRVHTSPGDWSCLPGL